MVTVISAFKLHLVFYLVMCRMYTVYTFHVLEAIRYVSMHQCDMST